MGMIPEGLNFFSGGALQTLKTILIAVLVIVLVIVVASIIIYKKVQKKRFNIPLVIITPRSDGTVAEVNDGLGGFFKSKKVGGITSFRVKRKGIGVVEIPPPPSSYLTSPNRTLFLAQKGVDDYQPINPNQLNFVNTELEVIEEGVKKVIMVKQPILNLKAINQDATAWQVDNAESANKRFTFLSIWEKYQVMITLMLFVFILFLILYINWMGMKDVVIELAKVAEALKGTSVPVITPGG